MDRTALQRISLATIAVAAIPYLALKVLWLGGSTIGTTGAAGAATMQSTPAVVGNAVTVVLQVLAVFLALALSRPWGRRVPAWLVTGLAVGAAGLLAPIMLGLPIGLVVQLLVEGSVTTGGGEDGLEPWVYGVVYSGFVLLAAALAVLFGCYVRDRWGWLVTRRPAAAGHWTIAVGAIGLVPYGVAMTFWGLAGPGTTGPAGMTTPVQRTVLLVTGLLALGAFVAPLTRVARVGPPQLAWLLTWVGCSTTALQALTHLLLARDGLVQPALVILAGIASPSSCAYGLTVLRDAQRRLVSEPNLRAAGG